MDSILNRLPNPANIAKWANQHRWKILGFLAGTVGTFILTTFLVVAITGVPFGGERLDPDRTVIYPNF